MGLFCIDIEQTAEAQIKAALQNLSMFARSTAMDDIQMRYLLGFVEVQLQEALEYIQEDKHPSGLDKYKSE